MSISVGAAMIIMIIAIRFEIIYNLLSIII